MDDAEAIANLRIEVNTLSSQVNGASLPQALSAVRRTVIIVGILVSVALLASSAIHAWSTREVRDLRREVRDLRNRVERLEARDLGTPQGG